jgi:BlaI family transcriptional regulator, penicillinase repressor
MTKLKLDLSHAEWEIMETVWGTGGAVTVRQVLDAAYPNAEKAYTTVQTFMNILVEKGVLKRKKSGGVNLYTAAITREKIRRRAVSTVARHMFSGSFGALASYLVNSDELTPEEIAALKALLNEKKRGA